MYTKLKLLQFGSPASTVASFTSTIDDPFKGRDPFSRGGGALAEAHNDPFQNDDPFREGEYLSYCVLLSVFSHVLYSHAVFVKLFCLTKVFKQF